MKTEVKKATDAELLESLANATYTGCCAGGHTKARFNEEFANSYKEELTERGVAIPDRDALLDTGIFNGPGSF